MELWTEIDKIRAWAEEEIRRGRNWGAVEWYPYSDTVNVAFRADRDNGGYLAYAYLSTEAGDREEPPYIVLI